MIPPWVKQRLLEELKAIQLIPNAKTIQLWMRETGYVISRDTALHIIHSLKPQLLLLKEQNNNDILETSLWIDTDIYQALRDWKTDNNILNDGDALNQLMKSYFNLIEENTVNTLIEIEINNHKNDAQILDQPPVSQISLLNQSQLAERLQVSNATLSKQRNHPRFTAWTQQRDPDNLAWQWIADLKKYQSSLE